MSSDKISKTVHQYSMGKIPQDDMEKLQAIAEDYGKVKNYIYQRYGGVKSLSKLYPGYTVQNEMTGSGLRGELGLPSVYFYLAVYDALGDIRSQWTRTKSGILKNINQNANLGPEDRHYIRFVMKIDCLYQSILCGRKADVPAGIRGQYETVSKNVDTNKLNRYLCRQTRKKLSRPHTDRCGGFAIAERAYRYGDHGIYLSVKEKRRRVFVPLTDGNAYKRQLYVKLFPERSAIEIDVPIEVSVRRHEDYENIIGLSMGVWQLFTTDSGAVYGEGFGQLHQELTGFMVSGNRTYAREKHNNPGRKKYEGKKAKLKAGLHAYVNQEINRMIDNESPKTIYIPTFPRNSCAGISRRINYSITLWQRGYVRRRLEQKCREQGIELAEVLGKDISRECSRCGSIGAYEKEIFRCPCCGYETDKKANAARNAKNRGESGGRICKESIRDRSGQTTGS